MIREEPATGQRAVKASDGHHPYCPDRHGVASRCYHCERMRIKFPVGKDGNPKALSQIDREEFMAMRSIT